MKKTMIWATLLCAMAASGCKDTEIEEVWEDRYVYGDTLQTIDCWYLEAEDKVGAGEGVSNFSTPAIYLDKANKEVYVANEGGKNVCVYDIESRKLLRTLQWMQGETSRTEAHDVYVSGDWVIVAAGNMREVQIFDRKSGEYLTRLGTGNWSNSQVSWAGCVCATDKYVFVRDSKYKNIRVFDRSAIDTKVANNNTYFAALSTEENFIGSGLESNANPYDMEVIGDSLYAFVYAANTIYSYSLKDIETKGSETAFKKTILPQGAKVYAAVEDNGTVWASLDWDGQKKIAEYKMEDFYARNFGNAKREFASNGYHKFAERPIIGVMGERLVVANGASVEWWKMVDRAIYVLEK